MEDKLKDIIFGLAILFMIGVILLGAILWSINDK